MCGLYVRMCAVCLLPQAKIRAQFIASVSSGAAAAEDLQLQSKAAAAAQAQLSFNDRLCCRYDAIYAWNCMLSCCFVALLLILRCCVGCANSIVFDYLQSKQLLNTVSVFAPESSIGNTALPRPDLLQALHLPAATPLSGAASVLNACVAKLGKQVLPAFVEVGSQTESGSGSAREHLGETFNFISLLIAQFGS